MLGYYYISKMIEYNNNNNNNNNKTENANTVSECYSFGNAGSIFNSYCLRLFQIRRCASVSKHI
jgi:hypothetical protein